MSLIPFPDVPNVPGVPAVFRSITVPTVDQIVKMAMGAAAEAIFGKTVWAIYEDVPAVPAVVSTETKEIQTQLDQINADWGVELKKSDALQVTINSEYEQMKAATAAGDTAKAATIQASINTNESAQSTIINAADAKYRGPKEALQGQIAESDGGSPGSPAVAATITEALIPDSFLDIDYKQDTRVSQYPQEEGAFASYNKVGTPYDCRVKMAIGGDEAKRTAFLDKCDLMLNTTDLYTVVTPNATYLNASLQNYRYRRESKNGVSILTVELWFIEVRITAVAEFSPIAETDAPVASAEDATPETDGKAAAADPVSDGQVQAVEPTPAQDAPTNFVSGSSNDEYDPTTDPTLSPAARAQAQSPDPSKNKLQDRLDNPPPGYNEQEKKDYKLWMETRPWIVK